MAATEVTLPSLSRCASVHLTALGVPFVVDIQGEGADLLAAAVRAAWSRCLIEDEAGEDDVRVVVVIDDDPDRVSAARETGALAGDDLDWLMDCLTPAITRMAITSRAEDLFMLHAGAVAQPHTGRAIALVGPSGAGKTTAVRRLAADLAYVTDETVAIDDGDQLVAYPKPLSICTGPARKDQVSPDVLALGETPAACRLVSMVVLCRDGGRHSTPRLSPVPMLEALAVLAPETSYLPRRRRPLHRLAGIVEEAGGLQRLHYRDADDLPGLVAELVGS